MFNIDDKTVKEMRDYAREQGYKIPGMRVMVKADLYTRIAEIETQSEQAKTTEWDAIDKILDQAEKDLDRLEQATRELDDVKVITEYVDYIEASEVSPTGEPTAQAGAADSGHSPATNDTITLVTTAPKAYDGFSVTELDSQAGIDNRGVTFRKVTIEARDRDWYEGRVASGLHAIATETEARRFPTIWRFIERTETQETDAVDPAYPPIIGNDGSVWTTAKWRYGWAIFRDGQFHKGNETGYVTRDEATDEAMKLANPVPPQTTHRDAYLEYIATEPDANANALGLCGEHELTPTCTVNCKPDGRITRASNWFEVFNLAKKDGSKVKAVPGEERGVKFTAYYLVQ